MAENKSVPVPAPTPLQQKAAKEQFALATRLLTKNNFADAIELIRACCRLDPANLQYRSALRGVERQAAKSGTGWLGKAALKTKHKMAKLRQAHADVLELGEAILALDPTDVACQLDMADSAMALGLADVALWILKFARQQESSDAVNLALAKVFEHMEDFQKAITLLQQISPAYHDHAELQQRIKDLMANDSIRRAMDAQPGEPQQSVNDTDQMTVAGSVKTDPAVPTLNIRQARDIDKQRERITADPANVSNYMALATLLRRAGDFKQCRDVLREGLKATADHFELKLALVDLKIEHKRQAIAEVEKRIKADPGDDSLRSTRSALLQDLTRSELQYYQEKVKFETGDPSPRYELAVRLYRAGHFQDAVRELQMTRESPRFQWQSLAYLGLSFEKMQVWPLAQRNLKEALQKLPAEEQDWRKRILFHLAQGTAAAGELAEAIQLGYELANLDFTYREIDRLIAQWREKQNEE
jgi:Tfp pilus assembly protein PilF